MDWLMVAAGLVLLLLAGDALVKGAVNLALRLGIPALIVSLTVVAFGTSAPELLVSVDAILKGTPGIALGNVVGSNIFNIGLILGGTAVILPLDVDPRIVSIDMWVMLAVSLLVVALAHWNVPIKKLGGIAMLLVFAVYIISVF